MKFVERTVVTMLCVAALVALHQIISTVMSNHNWKGMEAGDWATWIGAIGTVATLVMTIRIATTETRRRRHEELAKANIAAAALAPRIDIATRKLVHFKTKLMFQNLEGNPFGSVADESAFLLSIDFTPASTEELLTLVGIEGGLASKLAYAQARFFAVVNAISDSVNIDPDRPLSSQDAQKWVQWCDDLSERFTVIAASCMHAARTHAPPPTPDELYRP